MKLINFDENAYRLWVLKHNELEFTNFKNT
jgi:hypothetical protein